MRTMPSSISAFFVMTFYQMRTIFILQIAIDFQWFTKEAYPFFSANLQENMKSVCA